MLLHKEPHSDHGYIMRNIIQCGEYYCIFSEFISLDTKDVVSSKRFTEYKEIEVSEVIELKGSKNQRSKIKDEINSREQECSKLMI